jgi:hypothetical protein
MYEIVQAVMHLYKTSTCWVSYALFSSLFTLSTTKFNTKNFTIPDSACVYTCQIKVRLFSYARFNVWSLKTKTRYVHYAVNAESSNKFQVNLRLCVVSWCRRLVAGLSTGRFGCAGFLRVFPLTFPNYKTRLQNIVYQYEQNTGAQFNRRKSKAYK